MCGRGLATASLSAGAAGQLFFDAAIPPIREVIPGQPFEVDTVDCTGGLIQSSTDLIEDVEEIIERLGGLNFVSGPIAVSGARAGDVLRISVLDIDPAPETGHGFTALVPGFGALVSPKGMGLEAPLAAKTTICEVTRDHVVIPLETGSVRLPAAPFIGTVGVAPVRERRMTLSQSPDYAGDLDIPFFRTGSTLHIRANHDQGLISVGDVHAVQGDGEMSGVAVEIAARMQLQVDLTGSAESYLGRHPMLTDAKRVGMVAAFQGTGISACVRAAAVDLVRLLVRQGMSQADAVLYLTAAARIRVGNMFEPFYSAYVFVERDSLPVAVPDALRGPAGNPSARL